MIVLDRSLAWAAAMDAAARSSRKHGRKHWNRDDYNVAVEEFHRLWPESRDRQEKTP